MPSEEDMEINKNIIDNSIMNTEEEKNKTNKYRSFNQIVNTFYNEEIEEIEDQADGNILLKGRGTIKLEPVVIYDKFKRKKKNVQNKRLSRILYKNDEKGIL